MWAAAVATAALGALGLVDAALLLSAASPAQADSTETLLSDPVLPNGAFVAVTGPAPSDFVLPVLDQPPMALRSAQGKVVLVHLFATWCEPCREELPALSRLAARYPDQVRVLAIDIGEVDARVRRFFETLPVSFPILLDRDRTMMRAWGVSALPTTFVLDAGLQLRYRAVGDVAWDSTAANQLIAGLAATPPLPLSPQHSSAFPGPASAAPHAAIAVTGGLPQ